MQRVYYPLVLALALVVPGVASVTGCGKTEPPPGATSPTVGTSGSTASQPSTDTAATEQEAQQFARQMELAYEAYDTRALHELIDWESMAERATRGLGSAELQKGMRMGLVSGSTGTSNIFNEMRRTGGENHAYKYVSTTEDEGHRYVWFRVSGDSGINYHRFTVVKQGDRARANDLFLMLSGESLAQTWRRLMIPTVNEQSKNWLQKLTTSESEYYRHHHLVDEMVASLKRSDGHAALAAYERLPESVRREKFLLLMRYQAASAANDSDEVIAAAADMQRHHPRDNCLDLIMIDMYIYQEDYDSALACLDRIDKTVGTDPYLDTMRGGILIAARNFPEAKAMYERCKSKDPGCMDAYWGMVSLGTATGDHQLTYDSLQAIEANFQVDWNDLRNQPEYASFVASPEGRQWLTEHGF